MSVSNINDSLCGIAKAFSKNKLKSIEAVTQLICEMNAGGEVEDSAYLAQSLKEVLGALTGVRKENAAKKKEHIYPSATNILENLYRGIVDKATAYFEQVDLQEHIPLGFSILQNLDGVDAFGLAAHFKHLTQMQSSMGRIDVYTRYEQGRTLFHVWTQASNLQEFHNFLYMAGCEKLQVQLVCSA